MKNKVTIMFSGSMLILTNTGATAQLRSMDVGMRVFSPTSSAGFRIKSMKRNDFFRDDLFGDGASLFATVVEGSGGPPQFAGMLEKSPEKKGSEVYAVQLEAPKGEGFLTSAVTGRKYLVKAKKTRMSTNRRYTIRVFRQPTVPGESLRGLFWDIEAHPLVQRLSQVTQLGSISFIFRLSGKAYHRLEHSRGVADLALRLGRRLMKATATLPASDRRRVTRYDVFVMEVASLLHDVGHGPFSHQFDQYLDRLTIDMRVITQPHLRGPLPPFPHHEERGVSLARLILEDCWNRSARWKAAFPYGIQKLHEHVVALILGTPHMDLPPCISHTVNADSVHTVDLDRLDYLPRDAALLLPTGDDWKPTSLRAIDACTLTADFRELVFDPEASKDLLELRSHMYITYYSKTALHGKAFDEGMRRMINGGNVDLNCLFVQNRLAAAMFCHFFTEERLLKLCRF